ncbi:MAG: hypothetical protein K2X27_01750 [Candidatus Obscuribacterales bacterium]|nr:hypothetical protein [Candidatus Obscuribacterales bacterium]
MGKNSLCCNRMSYAGLFCLALIFGTAPSGTGQNYKPSGNFRSYSGGFGSAPAGSSYNGAFGNLNQISQTQYNPATSNRGGQRNYSNPSLEETLNAIDNPAAWYRTPVSAAAASPPSQNTAISGIMPNVSKKEVLRVFLEGGNPQLNNQTATCPGPAYNSSNSSTAYSAYQTAENEAAKARNQESRARYGNDQWNRKNAASQAEYAARNANYAASRAESAAYGGDSKAQSYANLARQAANRARASADRARYNADTIR